MTYRARSRRFIFRPSRTSLPPNLRSLFRPSTPEVNGNTYVKKHSTALNRNRVWKFPLLIFQKRWGQSVALGNLPESAAPSVLACRRSVSQHSFISSSTDLGKQVYHPPSLILQSSRDPSRRTYSTHARTTLGMRLSYFLCPLSPCGCSVPALRSRLHVRREREHLIPAKLRSQFQFQFIPSTPACHPYSNPFCSKLIYLHICCIRI